MEISNGDKPCPLYSTNKVNKFNEWTPNSLAKTHSSKVLWIIMWTQHYAFTTLSVSSELVQPRRFGPCRFGLLHLSSAPLWPCMFGLLHFAYVLVRPCLFGLLHIVFALVWPCMFVLLQLASDQYNPVCLDLFTLPLHQYDTLFLDFSTLPRYNPVCFDFSTFRHPPSYSIPNPEILAFFLVCFPCVFCLNKPRFQLLPLEVPI